MQFIRFVVTGQVPDSVMEYIDGRAGVSLVSLDPLEIAAEDSVSFASLDRAVRNLGLEVRHVFLRRGLDVAERAI